MNTHYLESNKIAERTITYVSESTLQPILSKRTMNAYWAKSFQIIGLALFQEDYLSWQADMITQINASWNCNSSLISIWCNVIAISILVALHVFYMLSEVSVQCQSLGFQLKSKGQANQLFLDKYSATGE